MVGHHHVHPFKKWLFISLRVDPITDFVPAFFRYTIQVVPPWKFPNPGELLLTPKDLQKLREISSEKRKIAGFGSDLHHSLSTSISTEGSEKRLIKLTLPKMMECPLKRDHLNHHFKGNQGLFSGEEISSTTKLRYTPRAPWLSMHPQIPLFHGWKHS